MNDNRQRCDHAATYKLPGTVESSEAQIRRTIIGFQIRVAPRPSFLAPPLSDHHQAMLRHIRIIWTSTTLLTSPQDHFYCRLFSSRSRLTRSDHAAQTFITAFNGGRQASTDDHHLVPPVRSDQLDPLQTRSVVSGLPFRDSHDSSSLLNLPYFLMLAYLGEEQKTIPQIGTAPTGRPEDNKIFGKPTQGFSSK